MIDEVISYADIYRDNLDEKEIQYFDRLGVEWRGRNINEIRDDIAVKILGIIDNYRLRPNSLTPDELSDLKAVVLDFLDTEEDEEEDEPSPLVYRFDPISRTYQELTAAEKKLLKGVAKAWRKATRAVKKTTEKAVDKTVEIVRDTGRWIKDHPIETAAIVLGAAAAGIGIAALVSAGSTEAVGGAVAAAAGAGTAAATGDSSRSKDNKPASPPSPSSTSSNPLPINVIPPNPNFIPITSTSTPLPQDLVPKAHLHPYESSSGHNPSFNPQPYVPPSSLTTEYPTYSGTAPLVTHTPIQYTPLLSTSQPNLPTIDRYKEVEFSPPHKNGINFNGSLTLPLPGYQEPPTSHLSSTVPKTSSAMNPTNEEPWTDFVKGVSKGFPRGCADSIKETPATISTFVKAASTYVLDPFIHPLDHLPGKETVSQALAVYETISYLRTCDEGEVRRATGELIKAVAPEAHKLFTDWDNLSLEERGDLSAYCAGKYGTDFLLPIAAGKGVKVVGGVLKEVSVLEKFANIQELIKVGQGTPLLAKELGFTKREIAQLSKTGALDKTVSVAFENIIRDKAMLASLEKFRTAEEFLKTYRGQYLSEIQAKKLIQQFGINTYPRPEGIPETFLVKISNNGAGIKYIDPQNIHISVRVMPGKPHSPFSHQREPYVIHTKHGNTLDKFGNVVSSDSPEAHIPVHEFNYR